MQYLESRIEKLEQKVSQLEEALSSITNVKPLPKNINNDNIDNIISDVEVIPFPSYFYEDNREQTLKSK